MECRDFSDFSSSVVDGEDSNIADHIDLFIRQLKHKIPLQSVIQASATESPENTLPLLREASAAVAEQLRRLQVLKSLALHYGTALPQPSRQTRGTSLDTGALTMRH